MGASVARKGGRRQSSDDALLSFATAPPRVQSFLIFFQIILLASLKFPKALP
jgi:hypothetical protein